MEIFVSIRESDRGRIGGFVQGTKNEAKRSDREPQDYSSGL